MYCPLVIKPYWNPIQIPLNLIGSVWLGSPAGKAKCPSLRRFQKRSSAWVRDQSSQKIIGKSEKKLGKICGNMGKYGENAVPNQWGYCKTDKKLDQQDITRLSIRSNQMSAWASKTPKVPKQIASRTTCFLAGLPPLP
jgi:hypothetical protein